MEAEDIYTTSNVQSPSRRLPYLPTHISHHDLSRSVEERKIARSKISPTKKDDCPQRLLPHNPSNRRFGTSCSTAYLHITGAIHQHRGVELRPRTPPAFGRPVGSVRLFACMQAKIPGYARSNERLCPTCHDTLRSGCELCLKLSEKGGRLLGRMFILH
jgi:hypothetical protein